MEQYIDKAALAAELERLFDNDKYGTPYECGFRDGNNSAIDFVKFLLDTIKVKEVDLETIINDYFKDWKFDDELDIMVKPNNYSVSFTDLKDIAKHFFELGVKVQKGK